MTLWILRLGFEQLLLLIAAAGIEAYTDLTYCFVHTGAQMQEIKNYSKLELRVTIII